MAEDGPLLTNGLWGNIEIYTPSVQARHKASSKQRHLIKAYAFFFQAFLVALGFPGSSNGKKSPAMKETWIGFLGREDSLEKGVTSHSSILVRRIPWSEEPGGLKSMGSQSQTGLSNWKKKKKIQTLAIKSFTRTWIGTFSS